MTAAETLRADAERNFRADELLEIQRQSKAL
jgi:hypothetical protein